MDYEAFLVSSMREAHIHGQAARPSVVHGFDHASRVVVAAAIIMVAVFSGFIFSHDIMIKQVGFALAAGILIDAFIRSEEHTSELQSLMRITDAVVCLKKKTSTIKKEQYEHI